MSDHVPHSTRRVLTNLELTAGDVRDTNEAAGQIDVKGARLPEAILRFSNR
jgi:hypothetical protein